MSIAKEHRWLLLAVCAAQFFMPFMVAGVNAVLPPLGESLGASARELSLLGAVYTLGLVVFQLAVGTLGDIYGRRRVFLFGLSLFSVLALVLGFIPHIDVFIGLRLFQGMGAAMLSSSSLALLASAAPKEMRASYLGLSGVAVYAGIACGPPVGGLVAGWLGWRWLFWGTGLAALEKADGLALGSPVYFGNVTGAMRSFQERLCFPYLVYDRRRSTIAPRRLAMACIYTMNVDAETMRQHGYPETLAVMDGYLGRIFSTPSVLYVTDTWQFDDYARYVADRFSEANKRRRREEQFPQECRQAFVMGQEMGQKLAGQGA